MSIPKYSAIKYVTSYGEHCTATQKDGIVTILGDKNGVKKMPLVEFAKDFVKEGSRVILERSPKKDTLDIIRKSKY